MQTLRDWRFWLVIILTLFLVTLASWSFMVHEDLTRATLVWPQGEHSFTVFAPDGTEVACVPASAPGTLRLAYRCTQVAR